MPGSLGNRDGKGTQARFCHPTMLDTDEDGNVYVVDNATAVRRITPSGKACQKCENDHILPRIRFTTSLQMAGSPKSSTPAIANPFKACFPTCEPNMIQSDSGSQALRLLLLVTFPKLSSHSILAGQVKVKVAAESSTFWCRGCGDHRRQQHRPNPKGGSRTSCCLRPSLRPHPRPQHLLLARGGAGHQKDPISEAQAAVRVIGRRWRRRRRRRRHGCLVASWLEPPLFLLPCFFRQLYPSHAALFSCDSSPTTRDNSARLLLTSTSSSFWGLFEAERYRGLLGALLVGFLAGVGATFVTTRVQRGGGIASVGPTTLVRL